MAQRPTVDLIMDTSCKYGAAVFLLVKKHLPKAVLLEFPQGLCMT